MRAVMKKTLALLIAALLPAAAAAETLGPDAAACVPAAAGPAALVTVSGFKDRVGRLRVQFYRGTPDEYLASGRYLRRQEIAMTAAGDMAVCLVLPGAGDYAVVALHDRNSDGKLSIWSDGIGFSNNPRLGLSKPPPEKTLVRFDPGVSRLRIVMNYRRGLSVRPME